MHDQTTEAELKDVRRKAKTPDPEPSGPPTIFDLQRSAGNAAVVSLLTESPVQTKLQVGAVNDPAEAEADRVADQVLRNLQADQVARRGNGKIHRKSPAEIFQATVQEAEQEEQEAEQVEQASEAGQAPEPEQAQEEEEQEQEAEEAAPVAQNPNPAQDANAGAADESNESETEEAVNRVFRPVRRAATGGDASGAPGHGYEGGAVESAVATKIESARGGGRPLDDATRTRMETGFGADFSDIRMHTGSQAEELNRSLNARAFTTGSDIFVGTGGMDDRVLAHELAHTVQQGGAGAQRKTVNRFMAVSEFEALTYESVTSMKSTAQNEIIKMLKAYQLLVPPPKKKGEKPKVPPEKLDNAIALVTNMKAASRAYIDAKKDAKDKKAKRLAGFVSFEIDCDLQLEQLNTQKTAASGVAQEPVTVDDKGLQKLQQHYKGTLSGSMEKAALAVEQLAGENGASGEFTLDVEVPVSPGVFVGAHFKFEAKRGGKPKDPKPGPVEVGCELGFIVGGNALFAKIQAGIGGYFKAQGKDAASAMKLVSYGLYRRCRESSVVPAEIANKLWGGDSGEKGKKKAEQWSIDVENEEFGDNDSFVETGAYASVGAKGGVEGVAEGEGEVKASMGKKYDKESLENSAKGGVGKENTTGDNWFAQKSTGRDVKALELSAKAALLDAFGAEFKLGFQWEASGKKGEPSTLRGIEIKVSGHGSLPSGAFADKLSALIIDFCTKVKSLQKGQLQKASGLSQVGAGVGTAAGIADTTVTGIEGAPTSEVIAKLLAPAKEGAKKAVGLGAKGGGESLVDSASKVGLELAYTFKYEDGACWSQFEILHRKALDAKIPGLLSAELIRRKRLLVGSNQGGSWAWELLA